MSPNQCSGPLAVSQAPPPPQPLLLSQRLRRPVCAGWILLLTLLALPAPVLADQYGDFGYTSTGSAAIITNYTGAGGAVAIPDTLNALPVTGIGERAFFDQPTLTSVTIPAGITNIGNNTFYDCPGLASITVASSNPAYTTVDGILFNKNQSILIQWPGAKAGTYSIPSSVTIIENGAFAYSVNLTSVTVHQSVVVVGDSAFWACAGLTTIAVDALNPYYSSVNGVLFNKTQTALIQYPAGKSGSYTISNSVTGIVDGAFGHCTGLTGITIPGSVTAIGSRAFFYCTGLTSVTVPNSVVGIGDMAFAYCHGLVSAIIGNGTTGIGYAAFTYCTALTGVYCLGNAPYAGAYIFEGDGYTIVYYLPGAAGWGATYGERPTATWQLPYPVILSQVPSFGVHTNAFCFLISWANNPSVVVLACTNLAQHAWVPVATNPLVNGSSYFRDPGWTNSRARFYRLRSP